MIELKNFHVLTTASGKKSLRSQVYPSKYSVFESLLSMYMSEIELRILKKDIVETKKKRLDKDIGQNSLAIYIDCETTKIKNVDEQNIGTPFTKPNHPGRRFIAGKDATNLDIEIDINNEILSAYPLLN